MRDPRSSPRAGDALLITGERLIVSFSSHGCVVIKRPPISKYEAQWNVDHWKLVMSSAEVIL